MRKITLTAAVVATGLLATAGPASAIRYGELDDGEHPYVGLMVAYDIDDSGTYVPLWRCSGSMIDEDTFLTAGHCTDGADAVAIWFDEDLRDAAAVGYPDFDQADATGTPYAHPEYDDGAFYLHDVGVVELDEAYPLDTYGALPEEGILDEAVAGTGTPYALEVVGYGLQKRWPDQTGKSAALRLKMKADVSLINNDRILGNRGAGDYIVVSNNANGGLCSGDSGGPTLIRDTDTIVGVNSFVVNGNCAGLAGIYRIDQPDDLTWISGFLD
jgi:secreted trypsin-like serine protease